MAGRTYALSRQLARSYPIGQVARVRNELTTRARVDGAFARADGAVYLLSADQLTFSIAESNSMSLMTAIHGPSARVC